MKDKTLKPVLIVLALLNFIDYVSTTIAVAQGIPEANFFMDALIGTAWFPFVKLIIVPLGIYFIWHVRNHWQQRLSIGLLLGFVFLAYTGVTLWHIAGQFFM